MPDLSIGLVLSGVVLFASYMVPFWIALGRGHCNASGVFAVNLLFGWTAIGWLVALVWALEKPEQA